jgi:transposase
LSAEDHRQKSFGRGQSYVSVLSDPQGRRVLEVEPGHDTAAARRLLCAIPAAQRGLVKAVSMDMSAAYESAARRELPQAAIVYDRFHVSKLRNEAVDQTRRTENRRLLAQGDERLKGTRYLWLQAPENMSAERLQCFERAVRRATLTAKAWEMKELFSIFWDEPSRTAAQSFFKRWRQKVRRRRGIAPVQRAATTLERHLPGLLNFIDHRITNAFAEGVNSLIHALKSAARGFRNFASFRTRILFFFGKLNLLPAIASHP